VTATSRAGGHRRKSARRETSCAGAHNARRGRARRGHVRLRDPARRTGFPVDPATGTSDRGTPRLPRRCVGQNQWLDRSAGTQVRRRREVVPGFLPESDSYRTRRRGCVLPYVPPVAPFDSANSISGASLMATGKGFALRAGGSQPALSVDTEQSDSRCRQRSKPEDTPLHSRELIEGARKGPRSFPFYRRLGFTGEGRLLFSRIGSRLKRACSQSPPSWHAIGGSTADIAASCERPPLPISSLGLSPHEERHPTLSRSLFETCPGARMGSLTGRHKSGHRPRRLQVAAPGSARMRRSQ
jgi:hypothetical protein